MKMDKLEAAPWPPTLAGIEIRERQAMSMAQADFLLARNRLYNEHDQRLKDIRSDFMQQRNDCLRDQMLARRDAAA